MIAAPPRVPNEQDPEALIEEARERARRRRRRNGAMLALAALAAGALYATAGHGGPPTAAHVHTGRPVATPAPSSASRTRSASATGMRGLVDLHRFTLSSPTHGVALFERWSWNSCYVISCGGGTPRGFRGPWGWAAITDNAGRSWRVVRAPSIEGSLSFADTRNGWAANGYVTHDGGAHWSRIPTPWPIVDVSVAGGRVWASSDGCSDHGHGHRCGRSLLVGSTAGGVLRPVPSQPVESTLPTAGPSIVAGGPRTAYVGVQRLNPLFVTRDGGRSWQTLAAPCPRGLQTEMPVADSPTSLWRMCLQDVVTPGGVLERSTDGGRHWRTVARHVPITSVAPVSSRIAWGSDSQGAVSRSTDGGRTWQRVLPARVGISNEGTSFASFGANTAAVVATVIRHGLQDPNPRTRTNLAVYRTRDGGRTWRRSAVALPAR